MSEVEVCEEVEKVIAAWCERGAAWSAVRSRGGVVRFFCCRELSAIWDERARRHRVYQPGEGRRVGRWIQGGPRRLAVVLGVEREFVRRLVEIAPVSP